MGKSIWTFEGFETEAGNRLVDEWFHEELSVDERDLIRDRINYLANVERHLWKRPGFDKLEDELHEIRKNCPGGTIRIYGYFPSGQRHRFVLLFGHYKTKNNDRLGKKAASDRLKLLKQGKGCTHEFDFEERTSGEDSAGEKGPGGSGSLESL